MKHNAQHLYNRIMKIKVSIISAVSILHLLMPQIALSDTMKCGTRLVRNGDTKTKVLLRCGEPFMKEVVGERTFRRKLYGGFAMESETVLIEKWTYIQGRNKFMRILTFEGDKLEKIEVGDKP
jgi:hypothetical protein